MSRISKSTLAQTTVVAGTISLLLSSSTLAGFHVGGGRATSFVRAPAMTRVTAAIHPSLGGSTVSRPTNSSVLNRFVGARAVYRPPFPSNGVAGVASHPQQNLSPGVALLKGAPYGTPSGWHAPNMGGNSAPSPGIAAYGVTAGVPPAGAMAKGAPYGAPSFAKPGAPASPGIAAFSVTVPTSPAGTAAVQGGASNPIGRTSPGQGSPPWGNTCEACPPPHLNLPGQNGLAQTPSKGGAVYTAPATGGASNGIGRNRGGQGGASSSPTPVAGAGFPQASTQLGSRPDWLVDWQLGLQCDTTGRDAPRCHDKKPPKLALGWPAELEAREKEILLGGVILPAGGPVAVLGGYLIKDGVDGVRNLNTNQPAFPNFGWPDPTIFPNGDTNAPAPTSSTGGSSAGNNPPPQVVQSTTPVIEFGETPTSSPSTDGLGSDKPKSSSGGGDGNSGPPPAQVDQTPTIEFDQYGGWVEVDANGKPIPGTSGATGGSAGESKEGATLTTEQAAAISGDSNSTPATPSNDTPSDHPAGGSSGGGGGGASNTAGQISSTEQAQQELGASSAAAEPVDNTDHGDHSE